MRRELKKLFILVLIVAFSLGNLASAKSSSDGVNEEYIINQMKEQEEALKAYELLENSFFDNSAGELIYPDEYSGEYISDDGKLIILLNTTDEGIKEQYYKLLSGYDCVELGYAEYSLNYLTSLAETVMNYSEDLVSCYVDRKENKVIVGIEDGTNPAISAPTMFKSSSDGLLVKDIPITYEKEELIKEEAALKGGYKISNTSYSFTLGICGYYEGTAAILTCGHNQTLNQNVSYTGAIIGPTYRVQHANGAKGDYSIIKLKNSSHTLTNEVLSGGGTSYSITNVYNNPPIGTILYKYGMTSGLASVKVTATNVSVNSSSGITINGMTKCSIISGNTAGGDSGGPYFTYYDGAWRFCGIHHGSSSSNVFFTPRLYTDLNFTIKTN